MSSSPQKLISICIPVFNESQNITHAVERVETLFAQKLSRYRHEIIIMDNASTDPSWAVIQGLSRTHSHLRGVSFSRNFGYQNSIFAGLNLAQGDAVVELDADLEDPPEVIEQFVAQWEQGYEVVYGVRRTRHAAWYLKLAFSLFYKIMNRISELRVPENSGDFRLLDRKVLDVLKAMPERNLYLRGLVAYLGFRQIPVVYDRDPRTQGRSGFRPIHYFTLALDAFTSFSKAPLRLMLWVGICVFLGAVALASYYLWDRMVHGTPMPGFTTVIVVLLGLHGLTFVFLGVFGEYLSRIFDDSKNRPRVIVREAVGFDREIERVF
jgi:dolichol-phosphate mannosyltransferase